VKLWLLRHARAEADSHSGRDRDRPLSPAGRTACQALNLWLKQCPHALPAKASVSPALRTRQTAQLALAELLIDCRIDQGLWMASTSDLFERVEQARGEASLFLVGHNPGMEELVYRLGSDLPVPGLKPGMLVILDVPETGPAQRVELVPPREST
jgi:phosphohistidine phosphatase